MANSAEFQKFMDPLNINFLPCFTASPWSNGAAEKAVQSIKKAIRHFIIQEKAQNNWDDYIFYYVNAHNILANVYNYSPEELHFGFTNPSTTYLLEFWPQFSDHNDYTEKIVPIAQELRKKAREKSASQMKRVLTYRNQKRLTKTFELGQIVFHRQLQVSTGQGGALKPLFTGPYVIEHIHPERSSATFNHMYTNNPVEAHFTYLQPLNYDPSTARLPADFDQITETFLPEKYTIDEYYPHSKIVRAQMNKEKQLLNSIPDLPEFDSDSDNVEYGEDQNDQELNFHDTSELFDLNNDYSFNPENDFSYHEHYSHDSLDKQENRTHEKPFSPSEKHMNVKTFSPPESITSSKKGSEANHSHKRGNTYSPSCADKNRTDTQNRTSTLTDEHFHSLQQRVNTTKDSHDRKLNNYKDETCTPLPQHVFETEIADDRPSQYSL
jgi:hypothetical protein